MTAGGRGGSTAVPGCSTGLASLKLITGPGSPVGLDRVSATKVSVTVVGVGVWWMVLVAGRGWSGLGGSGTGGFTSGSIVTLMASGSGAVSFGVSSNF